MNMSIQFLGATQTVTGSKYLLTSPKNKKYLIDCGLFQGLKELRLRNWEKFPFDPSLIDAVILTHAHLDHTGYLPLLVKNGFTGKVYATSGTVDLCGILLPDSGYLQEEQAERANRYGYSKHFPALPLYTMADAQASLKHLVSLDFNQHYTINDDIEICFQDAGHIIGAATLLIKNKNLSILFSGDLGRLNDPWIFPPKPVYAADYLVIESTYGDHLHSKEDPGVQLGNIINRTVNRGGTIIVPAFAVGRTQNILCYLHRLKANHQIPDIPVFLDSPMAQDATEILLRHTEEHRLSKEECEVACRVAKYVNTVEESKAIDSMKEPKIVISASGMATGGRVLHHLLALAGDPRNTILFAGYQAAGTRGEALVHGKRTIKLLGEMVDIQAEVIALDNVSAHADYEEILSWLRNFTNPLRKVFITHGELHAAESLKNEIEKTFHWSCSVPSYLQVEKLR